MMKNKFKLIPLIVPLGCNCLPAYILARTKLRRRSLPFDWLDIDPVRGLRYVHQNLTTDFRFFLKDLKKNDEGIAYSSFYDYVFFFHDRDLIEAESARKKYARRCERLMHLIKERQCFYLYNIHSHSIWTVDDLETLINSINDFVKLIKPEDRLLLMINYMESYDENKEFCTRIINEVSRIEKTKVAQFNRQVKQYGIWADPAKYGTLLRQLGLRYDRLFRILLWISFYYEQIITFPHRARQKRRAR